MKMTRFFHPTKIAVVLLLVTVTCHSSGCSSASSQPLPNQGQFTFPTQFEESGLTWAKSEDVSEADLRQLAAYFKNNPSSAEGPLISGDPTLYTTLKGAKRFYWGRSGANEPEWLFIQLQGRKGMLQEGTGAPFTN